MSIDPALLKILACPACDARPPVKLNADGTKLVCASCRRAYKIKDGIPIMLVEESEVEG